MVHAVAAHGQGSGEGGGGKWRAGNAFAANRLPAVLGENGNHCGRFAKRPQWFLKTTAVVSGMDARRFPFAPKRFWFCTAVEGETACGRSEGGAGGNVRALWFGQKRSALLGVRSALVRCCCACALQPLPWRQGQFAAAACNLKGGGGLLVVGLGEGETGEGGAGGRAVVVDDVEASVLDVAHVDG